MTARKGLVKSADWSYPVGWDGDVASLPDVQVAWIDDPTEEDPRYVGADSLAQVEAALQTARPVLGDGVGKPLKRSFDIDPSGAQPILELACSHEWPVDPATGLLSTAWKFAGSAGDRVTRSDCDAPNVLRCALCLAERSIVCGSRRESRCAPCSLRYKVRVRSIARMPMQLATPGSVVLLTLTAPGVRMHCLSHTYADGVDRAGVALLRPSKFCFLTPDAPGFAAGSGCVPCPCTTPDNALGHVFDGDVVGADGYSRPVNTALVATERMAAFNGSITTRFNRLLTDLRRVSDLGDQYAPLAGFADVEYFRAVEPQARGALHLHVLLRLNSGAVGVDSAVKGAFRSLAIAHGFGHEVDLQVLATADDQARAARYVAKYVTKTLDRKATGKDGVVHSVAVPMPELPGVDGCCDVDESPCSRIVRLSPAAQRRARGRMERAALIAPWERSPDLAVSPHVDARSHDHPSQRVRAWTASRGWGLSMGSLVSSQRLFARGFVAAARRDLSAALGCTVEALEALAEAGAQYRAANPLVPL